MMDLLKFQTTLVFSVDEKGVFYEGRHKILSLFSNENELDLCAAQRY